jgi:hypothetical protein
MRIPVALILCTSLLITQAPEALAEDPCEIKACIEVYTQDGKIIIEGRKGSGPKVSTTVAPAPKKSRKPTPKPVTPKPKVTVAPKATSAPKISTKPKAPVKKAAPRKSATATKPATSLSDKLIEILPTAGIAYSPSFSPLIKVPVYFWSDIPTVVTKKISIVGEVVEVKLSPTFFWHYGDGVFFVTRKVGAPYPEGEIQHTYSKPGHYLIQLITVWDGSFTIEGVTTRIPGQVRTVSVLPITVVAAPTRFLQ